MRPTTVVSSMYLMIWLELYFGRQSGVIRVNSKGLGTHPWGVPVFRVMTPELSPHPRTDRPLSERKSSSQLHRVVLRPKGSNLHTRSWGMIVLNAELKSKNSIRMWVFFCSNCSRLRWRAVEMASSVELLGW